MSGPSFYNGVQRGQMYWTGVTSYVIADLHDALFGNGTTQ